MSDAPLPDEMRNWPQDVYALLGVAHGVDRRTLRQAYTRLIRHYKPEHAPDQFRVLREAYEAVLQHVQWREKFGGPSADDGDEPLDNASTCSTPAEHEAPRAPLFPNADGAQPRPAPRARALLRSVEDQLDELWQQACGGGEQAAYASLRQLADEHPRRDDILLQLYWLVDIWPELDPARKPRDWLLQGLCRDLGSHALRELYRRECERDPAGTAGDDPQGWINNEAASEPLLQLLAWRWQAAARSQRWQVIADDLTRMRPRWSAFDPVFKGRIRLTALESLVWSRQPLAMTLAGHCKHSLETNHHIHTELSAALDRFDLLWQAACEWHNAHEAQRVDNEFLRTIPLCWNDADPSGEAHLLWLAEQFALDPPHALAVLDRVGQAHAMLSLLHRGWERLRRYGNRPQPSDQRASEVQTVVTQFMVQHAELTWPALRRRLLEFCTQQGIAPDEVSAGLSELSHLRHRYDQDLVECLRSDMPLRCAYQAHDVFWS